MSGILANVIEFLTHIAVDGLFEATVMTVTKDKDRLTKCCAMAGGFIVGEMVSEKATEWTTKKVQEAINAYVEMANALEEPDEDEDK